MAGATAEALQRIEAAIGQTTALTEARLVAVDGRLTEIRDELKKLNGTVRENCTAIELLKQSGQQRQVALEELDKRTQELPVYVAEQKRQGVNWDRLILIVLVIVQAVILARLGL